MDSLSVLIVAAVDAEGLPWVEAAFASAAEPVRVTRTADLPEAQRHLSAGHTAALVLLVAAGQELITFNGEACILSTILDISGRIQAETALRESETKYRALYDERFEVFKQIYKQMKSIHARLNTAAP